MTCLNVSEGSNRNLHTATDIEVSFANTDLAILTIIQPCETTTTLFMHHVKTSELSTRGKKGKLSLCSP
jgi:hypothetical protein